MYMDITLYFIELIQVYGCNLMNNLALEKWDA